jgi:hypothetical protein
MADLSKLKDMKGRRGELGAPPTLAEASGNLMAPEIAPAAAPIPAPAPMTSGYQRIDGRTARKSHRTIQFATRVSPDFDRRLREAAQREGLLLVEVLERSLELFENKANS